MNGRPLNQVMRELAGPNWMFRVWDPQTGAGLADVLADGCAAGHLRYEVVHGDGSYWLTPAPGKTIEDAVAYLRARAAEVTLRGDDS